MSDETFWRVDCAARRRGMSRSDFVAHVTERWLDALDDEDTTVAINDVTAGAPGDHAFTSAAATALIRNHIA